MIDFEEFIRRLSEKLETIMFEEPETDVSIAFNSGVSTVLSYSYVIATNMYLEEKEKC